MAAQRRAVLESLEPSKPTATVPIGFTVDASCIPTPLLECGCCFVPIDLGHRDCLSARTAKGGRLDTYRLIEQGPQNGCHRRTQCSRVVAPLQKQGEATRARGK